VPVRRGGEPESSPLLLRSLALLLRDDEEVVLEEEWECGAWGPMGITPVKMRFEAARARRVRPRVRQR
jgi:hypothetical protein